MLYKRKSANVDRTHRNGFTLIELALYMGLLGILITIISQFFIATLDLKVNTDSVSAVQQDGRYILSRLTYDLRRAKSINVPAVGQSASSLSATINDNGIDTSYQYLVNGTNLVLTAGSVSAQLNTPDTATSVFTVTRIGNSAQLSSAKDTLSIHLTLESTATSSSGKESGVFDTTVSLR